MPSSSSIRFGQAGEHHGGGRAVQARGAGEVEERLVQREGLDGGGQIFHHGADLARDGFDVDRHAGLHDHGLGAELQGLEHRHGGADALDAGDVAAGGDDAARAAADDHGLVAQGGVVALFDAGIEGVAIHVGDGERVSSGWAMMRGLRQAGQRGALSNRVRQSRQRAGMGAG